MPLDRLRTDRAGPAWRCVPDRGPFRPDLLVSRDGGDDRWNRPGEPTLYLALDPGVALAESGRHLAAGPSAADGRASSTPGQAIECHRLVRLRTVARDLLDLRDPAVMSEVGVAGPAAFLDRAAARQVAGRLRAGGACRGLVVPSVAFLDDLSRGNLVLFMEHIPGGVDEVVAGWEEAGRIEVRRP